MTHGTDEITRLFDEHRSALVGHCYRMLGSPAEADDAVQETMVRAWRALERFEGRASHRTWLLRIATNVCLDALGERKRRGRPMDLRPVSHVDAPLDELPSYHFVEPIPDEVALPASADPSQRAAMRQSIRLAFVAALQHLPPRQRAALLLTEVLGFSAAEVAESLEMTVAAVNSALQRARASLEELALDDARAPDLEAPPELLERYVDAFERYDVDALAALLHEDASMNMPPFALWLRGHDSIKQWLLGRGAGCRGSRLVRVVGANGAPAFGQYKPAPDGKGHLPWSLIVLEVAGGKVDGMTFFLDTASLFPRFGLPPSLP